MYILDPGCSRHKFCFTVRDSINDYINATVWGSDMYTARLFNSFQINDVGKTHFIPTVCTMRSIVNLLVQLCNSQIASKSPKENDSKWNPWTPRFIVNFYTHVHVYLYNFSTHACTCTFISH